MYTYDVTGHQLTGANSSGTGASATYSSATNWAAPDVLTPAAGTGDVQNGHTVTQAAGSALQNGYGYNSALSLVSATMPNSATASQNFSSSTGLLTSSVSVYGATTNYAYVFNPTIVTGTTNSHWSKSYRDGFGREVAHETGYGSTVVSHADTVYGACACSPLGKVVQVSQPYGINGATKITSDGTGNVAWTTYAYDSLGRTVSVTAADGSATQYSYAGNATTVTDPAGHWKTYTNNALGQLVLVTEPNPVYPSSNYLTSYSYDVEGHLTQVYMQRPTSGAGMQTQTRAFQYDLASGHLLSAANPENGTVSYAYYPDGLLKSKTDALGQKVVYSYDGYGRISYIDRYASGSQTADICQRLTLGYDDSNASAMGRLRSVNWGPPFTMPSSPSCGTMSIGERYGRNSGGQVTYKDYGANFQYCFSCDPPAYGPAGNSFLLSACAFLPARAALGGSSSRLMNGLPGGDGSGRALAVLGGARFTLLPSAFAPFAGNADCICTTRHGKRHWRVSSTIHASTPQRQPPPAMFPGAYVTYTLRPLAQRSKAAPKRKLHLGESCKSASATIPAYADHDPRIYVLV